MDVKKITLKPKLIVLNRMEPKLKSGDDALQAKTDNTQAQARVVLLPRKSRATSFRAVWMGLLALVVLGAAGAGLYVKQTKKTDFLLPTAEVSQVSQDPADLARKETLDAVKQASRIILLPTGEEPTVATVTDLESVRGQAFFAFAEVGDKILVYLKAGKAYLYRPAENKIIEVGTFDPSLNSGLAQAAVNPVAVEIRDGSGQTGAMEKWQGVLEKDGQIKIVAVGKAAKQYENSLVVNLAGEAQAEKSKQLAELFPGSELAALPSGEATSGASVLIIIGQR